MEFELQTGHDFSAKDGRITVKYICRDVDPGLMDAFDYVASYALANVPAEYDSPLGTLKLEDIQITENYYAKRYEISAPYSPRGSIKRPPGAYQITVDQTGGTVHVTAGRRIAGYGPAANAVNNGGLIGVEGGEVRGVDIPINATKITVLFRHPQGVLSGSYVRSVGALVGFPNDDSFLGYDPGEVLYKGGMFEQTDSEASATYHFDISPNMTNFTVGDINGVDKKGWDILCPHVIDDVFDNGIAQIPIKKIGYIEIVRPAGREWKNYSNTFGWGGS